MRVESVEGGGMVRVEFGGSVSFGITSCVSMPLC